MTILHGENQPQSRQALVVLLDQARQTGRDITRLEAAKLTPAILEETFGTTDLFGQPKTVVLEGLHSLPKSKKKDELIKTVAAAVTNASDSIDCILWESRALTKTMLKLFPQAQVSEYKVSNYVFNWLDSLSPVPKTKPAQLKLLHQAITNEDAYLCFAMLMRQIRLLIQAKDGAAIKGPPFMISKLKKQAQPFTLEQLLTAHHKLLEIDLRQKTSAGLLHISQELDLFVLQL